MSEEALQTFGVHNYGATLVVDPITWPVGLSPCFIDCETDEKDNFVGLGMCFNDKEVYYFTKLTSQLIHFLSYAKLVGHSLKGDAQWLKSWGVNILPENLYGDTILMSYTCDGTKDSHGLKTLGKERGYFWPSYDEIVGKGRGKSKRTLDKQPIGLVSNYCAMDVYVTHKLYEYYTRTMNIFQKTILNNIKLPLMRILFEMENQGVLIDVEKLTKLDVEFGTKLGNLRKLMFLEAGKEFNPNSNVQTAEILITRGNSLPTTQKGNKKVDKFALEQIKADKLVSLLLEYNKIEKLYSTYTQGFLKLKTLPKIYTTYNQITLKVGQDEEKGINTGRLSSCRPNLQQIPARTEDGLKLRELFIPKAGHTLIDADYSQIEYRLLAHFTKEPILIKAFMEGKDVHEETGKALGVDRDTGKTLNFASIYGAQAKKIARTAKIPEEQAKSFLDKYWNVLPRVTSWINRMKYEARIKRGVHTLMKWWIPLPGIASSNLYERMHWERAAVNYCIQGSAAEVLYLGMIKLREKGYLPLLTVHDELLFEVPLALAGQLDVIKNTMENVIKLDVPLVAEVGVGQNWKEAKGE
jgi:DNA polymerase I